MTNAELVVMLQSSVAPCILISGAGLLLLTLGNRLPRPIDRTRHICNQIKSHPGPEGDVFRQQLKIYYKRCHLLKNAIACNVIGIGAVATVILMLFVGSLFTLSMEVWVSVFFVLALFSIISSLMFFLRDITLTLKSLDIEVKETGVSGH